MRRERRAVRDAGNEDSSVGRDNSIVYGKEPSLQDWNLALQTA